MVNIGTGEMRTAKYAYIQNAAEGDIALDNKLVISSLTLYLNVKRSDHYCAVCNLLILSLNCQSADGFKSAGLDNTGISQRRHGKIGRSRRYKIQRTVSDEMSFVLEPAVFIADDRQGSVFNIKRSAQIVGKHAVGQMRGSGSVYGHC